MDCGLEPESKEPGRVVLYLDTTDDQIQRGSRGLRKHRAASALRAIERRACGPRDEEYLRLEVLTTLLAPLLSAENRLRTLDNLKSSPNLSTCRGNPSSSRSPTIGCEPGEGGRGPVPVVRVVLDLACCTGREVPFRCTVPST